VKKKHIQTLTNEKLGNFCPNQFEIVGRAIKIAEYLVQSGKAVDEWPDNIASEVLLCMLEDGPEAVEKEILQKEG